MSYPPSRYRADSGMINATLRGTAQWPELVYPSGGQVHYLATAASTGGEFGLYRWEMAAAPSGRDPHFHRTISESIYILTGAVRLFDGRHWLEGSPGDFLFVPEGVSMLSAMSPASPHRC